MIRYPPPPHLQFFLGFGNSHERLDWGWRHVPLTRAACYIVASVASPRVDLEIDQLVERSSRLISAEVESIERLESIDRANVKSSQSIISTWSRLLAVVQIQHEYNNNIVLTEVNKTVIFIVPNTYYCGHTHTHSLSLSFSVYVTEWPRYLHFCKARAHIRLLDLSSVLFWPCVYLSRLRDIRQQNI